MNNKELEAKQFKQYIEKQALECIKGLLLSGKINDTRASQLAKIVVDYIKPNMSVEQLYKNVVKLDDQHSEFAPLVHQIVDFYEKKHTNITVKEMEELIKSGKYDMAAKKGQEVIEYKK